LALLYFVALSVFFKIGNVYLFTALIIGEVFHVWQIIGFSITTWNPQKKRPFTSSFGEPVNIFITVAGEPVEVVEETVIAAKAIDYPSFNIHILNDGYVAKKDNWKEIEELAARHGIGCITRRKPGGAKAGNINNGLRHTKAPFIVIFDADHVPKPEFLKRTMGYFTDKKMGFVQTPQFYKNQAENVVTQTSWDQQALFFGPIMKGKVRSNSVFMCGTNMVLRRTMLSEVGGMCEFNIAEDFLTSLFVHEKGWHSHYVPEVLAEGLAPEDFLSYYKQQFRWTRGSLEVIFKYNPLFRKGLTWAQKMQYLSSASYYLSGAVVLIDALIPLIFLFFGVTAIITSSMLLALIFLPYIFLSLYILQQTSNFTYTYRAISFSISSFWLQLRALAAVLLNQKTSFVVTSKSAIQGNFLYLSIPHLVYIALSIAGVAVALSREGISASLLANLAWVLVNIAAFIPFILASAPPLKRRAKPSAEKPVLAKARANS
jgi:cellulose synthase (UDP-forming)